MGTALAKLIAGNGHRVYLWCRRKELADYIRRHHVNIDYYPNIRLPENIEPTTSFEYIEHSDVIFLAVPSHAIREMTRRIKKYVSPEQIIVNTAKGR